MKLLLDENLPKRLKQDLYEHEIYTANEQGWAGISNGRMVCSEGVGTLWRKAIWLGLIYGLLR